MNVLSEKPIALADAAELIRKRMKDQKEGAPLGYEQQNTFDYLSKFAHLSAKDAKAMRKELEDLDAGLNEKQLIKLVDLLPKKEEELKTILLSCGELSAPEKLKEILKVCKSYHSEKTEKAEKTDKPAKAAK